MFGENVEAKKEMAARKLPIMVTVRHPNLLARAETMGPKKKKKSDIERSIEYTYKENTELSIPIFISLIFYE